MAVLRLRARHRARVGVLRLEHLRHQDASGSAGRELRRLGAEHDLRAQPQRHHLPAPAVPGRSPASATLALGRAGRADRGGVVGALPDASNARPRLGAGGPHPQPVRRGIPERPARCGRGYRRHPAPGRAVRVSGGAREPLPAVTWPRAPPAQVDHLRRRRAHRVRGSRELPAGWGAAGDRQRRGRRSLVGPGGGRVDVAPSALRHRRGDQPHACLRLADGHAGGRLPRPGPAAAGGAGTRHVGLQPGGGGVDAGRGGAVPPGPFTDPGGGGPPLLPPQVRRGAHARGLQRAPARAGRHRLAGWGAAGRGGRDHAAGARVALAARRPAGESPPRTPAGLVDLGREHARRRGPAVRRHRGEGRLRRRGAGGLRRLPGGRGHGRRAGGLAAAAEPDRLDPRRGGPGLLACRLLHRVQQVRVRGTATRCPPPPRWRGPATGSGAW